MTSQTRKPVVLITGASTGIGLELGRLLLNTDAYHVVMTARKESMHRFESAGIESKSGVWLRELDVLVKAQRDQLIEDIESKLGGIDVLVNNAGFMLSAVVEHVNESERLKQMDVNFRAPLALIRAVLPGMRARHRGKIINVSSVGGMMAMPTMAIYSASKFALEGASEALWYEVKPWNISVTLVQPGFVNSEGFKHKILTRQSHRALAQHGMDYYYYYEEMAEFIESWMHRTPTSSESVARVIYRVIRAKNPALRVAGSWDAIVFSWLRRFLPRRFYHWLFWMLLPAKIRRSGLLGTHYRGARRS